MTSAAAIPHQIIPGRLRLDGDLYPYNIWVDRNKNWIILVEINKTHGVPWRNHYKVST